MRVLLRPSPAIRVALASQLLPTPPTHSPLHHRAHASTQTSTAGMSGEQEVKQRKAQLRRLLRAELLHLSAADISHESAAVTARILSFPRLRSAQAVCLYLSRSQAELRTDELLRRLFAAGKRVFVPRVSSAFEMQMLELKGAQDAGSLAVNQWGIPEPAEKDSEGRLRCELLQSSDSCLSSVSVCFVPGMGFTRCGDRLGHGRGYYDRYLRRWEEERRRRGIGGQLLRVGLALRCQLLHSLPTSELDEPLHLVITADDAHGCDDNVLVHTQSV